MCCQFMCWLLYFPLTSLQPGKADGRIHTADLGVAPGFFLSYDCFGHLVASRCYEVSVSPYVRLICLFNKNKPLEIKYIYIYMTLWSFLEYCCIPLFFSCYQFNLTFLPHTGYEKCFLSNMNQVSGKSDLSISVTRNPFFFQVSHQ